MSDMSKKFYLLFLGCVALFARAERWSNFSCWCTSSYTGYCSWTPESPSEPLYYKRINEAGGQNNGSDNPVKCEPVSCPTESNKLCCNLRGDMWYERLEFFNSSLSKIEWLSDLWPHTKLKPYSLKPKVQKLHKHLNISWELFDVFKHFQLPKVTVKYTRCDSDPVECQISSGSSCLVDYLSHCIYNISIIAKYGDKNSIPMKVEVIQYGRKSNPYALAYAAAVLLPVTCAIIAVVMFICIRKHKNKILPPVPEPSASIIDMLNNNMRSGHQFSDVCLIAPTQEEKNDSITVVEELLPEQPSA